MQKEAIKLIENSQYTQPFMYKLIQILSHDDYLDRDEDIIDIIHSLGKCPRIVKELIMGIGIINFHTSDIKFHQRLFQYQLSIP